MNTVVVSWILTVTYLIHSHLKMDWAIVKEIEQGLRKKRIEVWKQVAKEDGKRVLYMLGHEYNADINLIGEYLFEHPYTIH